MLNASATSRRWKEEAERLLDVFDNDSHSEDVFSTAMFYGYLRGTELSMLENRLMPFGNVNIYEEVTHAWKQIMSEYLREMRKGVGTEDVDF